MLYVFWKQKIKYEMLPLKELTAVTSYLRGGCNNEQIKILNAMKVW